MPAAEILQNRGVALVISKLIVETRICTVNDGPASGKDACSVVSKRDGATIDETSAALSRLSTTRVGSERESL